LGEGAALEVEEREHLVSVSWRGCELDEAQAGWWVIAGQQVGVEVRVPKEALVMIFVR